MRLISVYIRFYRSFNFDYLRKNRSDAEQRVKPWDKIGDAYYPYVRVPIDPKLTTIVGANESGKSHLLSAIEKGITGEGIHSSDFCRYSNYFTVNKGEIRVPDFGFEWGGFSETEKKSLQTACNIPSTIIFDSLFIFRNNSNQLIAYLPASGNHQMFPADVEQVMKLLPRPFRINANIALPDSVPLRALLNSDQQGGVVKVAQLERHQRYGAYEGLLSLISHGDWFTTAQVVAQNAQNIHSGLASVSSAVSKAKTAADWESEMRPLQIALAKDLIFKIANIDQIGLQYLYDALRDGNEGHANGIIEQMNKNLSSRLNFPKVWVQDREFNLRVTAREHDLVFTIRDKTNTEYSFSERSSGLKYFLSYYVQYLAHDPRNPETEILLMDEPDAYLSSQAQQDLLKIFRYFSKPEGAKPPVQVLYVTHSPFLIDKNNADRIRVLEKGSGDEGTRIVRNASQNHYEPLRSALGGFVGESTFIGNCNIMVEGTADQILLSGASTYLRSRNRREAETLDLNQTTIVPAGSATHIPYLVYLARGRDVEQPAVVVLFDGDAEGKKAQKDLKKGDFRGKQILKDEYVLRIDELDQPRIQVKPAFTDTLIEIEDLIPLPLCVKAAKAYAKSYWNAPDGTLEQITEDRIKSKKSVGRSVYDALASCLEDLPNQPHIDKIGFARAVIEALPKPDSNGNIPPDTGPEIGEFEANMLALLTRLKKMQRLAEKEQKSDRVGQKTERLKRNFAQDHPDVATREEAVTLLDEIEKALDDSVESDFARAEIQKLRRDHHLGGDLFQNVTDLDAFKKGLDHVKYAALRVTAGGTPVSDAAKLVGTSRKE